MTVRIANSGDSTAIRAVHLTAFPSSAEADLVDRLQSDGDSVISIVKETARGELVGHALFSRMSAPFAALGLGPVAVYAAHRNKGIAGQLIRYGLDLAKADNWQAVFVLGDPEYYERFGFSAKLARGFSCPYAGPYLMAVALGQNLPVETGNVEYAPAFSGME